MINAAKIVLEKSICTLSSVFQAAFPGVTYTAHNAKRRLLQLPLAAIRVHEASSGRSAVHLMEYMVGINYIKVAHFINACACQHATPVLGLTKVEFKQILSCSE